MSDTDHKMVPHVDQAPVRQEMHPMVKAAIESGAGTEQLEKLMKLQQDWEANEARKAYARALIALKKDLPVVLEHDKSVSFKPGGPVAYTHTTLGGAVAAVTPVLTDHGFSHSWRSEVEGDGAKAMVKVWCRLMHSDGHFEETELAAPADMSGSKSVAQGIASTSTLLRRHTLLSLLGIATADMQDPAPNEENKDRIDAKLNLRAMAGIRRAGHSPEEAEARVGKPLREWTIGDVDVLRQWLQDEKQDPPMREPGED